ILKLGEALRPVPVDELRMLAEVEPKGLFATLLQLEEQLRCQASRDDPGAQTAHVARHAEQVERLLEGERRELVAAGAVDQTSEGVGQVSRAAALVPRDLPVGERVRERLLEARRQG